VENRHNLHWDLYQQLLSANREFFGMKGREDLRTVVYDRGINFYNLKPLLNLKATKKFDMTKVVCLFLFFFVPFMFKDENLRKG
jgi:hypothetical protein